MATKDPFKDLAGAIRDMMVRQVTRVAPAHRFYTVIDTSPLTLQAPDNLSQISTDDDDVEIMKSVKDAMLAVGDVIDVRETEDGYALLDVVEDA